jgi:aminoglycoside 3-N-acetyltransferase
VVKNGAPVLIDGERRWVEIEDINGWMHDFDRIGDEFNKGDEIVRGRVGKSDRVWLMRQRPLVDFAAGWMSRNRREKPTVGSQTTPSEMPS